MGISDRLRVWNKVVDTRRIAEDPEVLGGRQAESFLQTLVESHYKFKNATLFPNKRVPAGDRRREIDLIVITTKRIHIIECKNWSGSLRIAGDRWVQTNSNNQEIDYPDLLVDNEEKYRKLIDYLRREGVSLDLKAQAKYLSSKVIFMNPNLDIRSRYISRHPDVLQRHQLNKYLNRQPQPGLGERIADSLIQWCLETESAELVMDGYFGSLTSEKVAGICAAINKLGTWDSLQYHGSRLETGDLIYLSISGEGTIYRGQIDSPCSCSMQWTRNKMWGLVKTLFGDTLFGSLHLPRGPLSVSPEDFVFFHRAGQRTPSRIPLLELDRITLG